MRSKIIKIFSVLLVLLIVGIFSLSLLIKTSFVQNKIVDLIKSSVSKSMGQQLKIGKVDFALIDGIVINDTELEIDNNKFLEARNITLGYPLSALNIINDFSTGHINVDSFKIDGLKLVLSKNQDGIWNYSRLSRKEPKNEDEQLTQKESSSWIVSINSFEILDTRVSIFNKQADTVRTIDINDFNSTVRLATNPAAAEINFHSGRINIDPDEIIINNLSSSTLKLSKEEVEIGELKFGFNGADIFMSGEFKNSGEKLFSVRTKVTDFSNEKLKLNLDFKGEGDFTTTDDINGKFSIDIDNSQYLENKFSFDAGDISIKNSVLNMKNATLDGDAGKAEIGIDTDLKNIFDKDKNNEFFAVLKLSDFDYSRLSKVPNIDTEIPADIEKIASALNAELQISGFFNASENFDLKTDIRKFILIGEAGDANLGGVLNISDSLIVADITGSTDKLDIGYLLNKKKYNSSINSKINIDASLPTNFSISGLKGSSQIDILKSRIFKNEIKSGAIRAKFSPNKIENVSVKLLSDFVNINASGNAINDKLDFSYDIKSENLDFISKIKDDLGMHGSADIKGQIKGTLESPIIEYALKLSDFKVKKLIADKGNATGAISFDEGISTINSRGQFNRLKYNDRPFNSLEYDVSTKNGRVIGDILLTENDNNNYNLEFKIADLELEKNIEFSKITLNFGDTEFKNNDTLVVGYSNGIRISGLDLGSNGSSIKGVFNISASDELKGDIKFINFELQNISELINVQEAFSGVVNGHLDINGNTKAPRLNSQLSIDNLKYREFASSKLNLNTKYSNKKFDINLTSDLQDNNKLNLSGFINTDLNFSNEKSSGVTSMDLSLFSQNLNLSPFSAFIDTLDDINGVIDLDLKIKGTPKAPRVFGNTAIKDTEFKLKQLKNKITIDNGNMKFDGDKAVFNEFMISSGDGTAGISGDFNLSDLSFKAQGEFDRFRINPKRIKTDLSGNLQLSGNGKDISAAGDATLNKTRITITQQKKQQVSEIKFVDQETNENDEIVIKDEEKGSYFKDHMALDLNVTIPKNSWVRGRGANIELKGKLKIDKEYKDEPLITGNISTVRGTYKIFGKLFKIQEGNVNFPAIKDLNPLLDITALYNVSDVDVFVGIGGDVKNPEIKLTSNPSLQETDIVSYLIFGTSSDKLGSGERSALGSAATGLAGGVALNQLKGVLGDNVSPDVLSFGSGESGPELEVGKYLNDDIYFAYERKSSSDSGSSIPTNTVKVEYRLFDFLSVGSDVGSEQSGGDIFFNFEY